MRILGIETSCDETALAIVEATGPIENPNFRIIAEALNSQTEIHKKYGGVFPMMAKREHAKNIVPLLRSLLTQVGPTKSVNQEQNHSNILQNIGMIFEREPELFEQFKAYVPHIEKPPIDAIAVTKGPGLEPALWVGINFARALSLIWNVPVIPINHMEGHILSVLVTAKRRDHIEFPLVALLISGGHTELVRGEDWLHYEILGQTRDDAVGEAFDKVARILGLPYPGGPEISKLAEEARSKNYPVFETLPRPMISSSDYDFSFSGLKTSVLYKVRDRKVLDHKEKAALAREFEDAVVDVLVSKTKRAVLTNGAKSLIIGGGVIANKKIRESFEKLAELLPDTKLLIPDLKLSTDNAVMISAAAYFHLLGGARSHVAPHIEAVGKLRLSTSSFDPS